MKSGICGDSTSVDVENGGFSAEDDSISEPGMDVVCEGKDISLVDVKKSSPDAVVGNKVGESALESDRVSSAEEE